MQPRTVIVCCAALLAAQISQSKIAPVPVNELIRSSDQIVIATVTHVLEDKADSYTVKHATATVRKTLKGRPLQSIRFRVVPANDRFMDSTADAIVGESALLFLYKQDNEEFGLKLAGRGRMPLRTVSAITYATLWNDVVLPANAPVIPGPDARYSFIVSVELAYLERLVTLQEEGRSVVP
jgi:hypothetical protein